MSNESMRYFSLESVLFRLTGYFMRNSDHNMNHFFERNRNKILLGTVTCAETISIGLLVSLKDCSFSSEPGVGERCGVAHVHLVPGITQPAVGERIACMGRVVNATKTGALLREATWKPEDEWQQICIEELRSKPKVPVDQLRMSELTSAHLQAAAAILTGLSYTSSENETMKAMLKGLRQPLDGPRVWSKDLLATEYAAVTCEQGFDYLFRCLAGAAEVADRLISEHRRLDQFLKSVQLVEIRNRIEAALFTLAEMAEARRLAREGFFAE